MLLGCTAKQVKLLVDVKLAVRQAVATGAPIPALPWQLSAAWPVDGGAAAIGHMKTGVDSVACGRPDCVGGSILPRIHPDEVGDDRLRLGSLTGVLEDGCRARDLEISSLSQATSGLGLNGRYSKMAPNSFLSAAKDATAWAWTSSRERLANT